MTPSDDVIDYAAWGEQFFATAITLERVISIVDVLGGQPIDVGPIGVGPRRLAKVYARGTIGTPTGQQIGDAPVAVSVSLPVSLKFKIDLGVDKQRFDADITVPLLIVARARRDLTIFFEVTPPRPEQVAVQLRAKGLRASITQYAAGMEGELRRFVARYVAREIEKPYVKAARLIDVGRAVESIADSMGRKKPTGEDMTHDLGHALEAELVESADLLVEDVEDQVAP